MSNFCKISWDTILSPKIIMGRPGLARREPEEGGPGSRRDFRAASLPSEKAPPGLPPGVASQE